MKFSYPLVTPEADAKIFAFQKGSEFEQNLAAIAEIGYDGVELMVRDASLLDADELKTMIHRHGLEIAAVGTSPMPSQDKLTLASEDADVRRRALERAMDAADLAGELGVSLCIGKFRGSVSQGENSLDALADSFKKICQRAEQRGTTVMLEPQNKSNLNNLNTIDESLAWVEKIGCANLGLLMDTYHMDITEKSMIGSIIKGASKTGFVHLSDNERYAVGAGRLQFMDILSAFDASGYKGWYSVEVKQTPDCRTAAAVSFACLDYIRKMLF
jgi:5-keto-L-gluconate epimerase